MDLSINPIKSPSDAPATSRAASRVKPPRNTDRAFQDSLRWPLLSIRQEWLNTDRIPRWRCGRSRKFFFQENRNPCQSPLRSPPGSASPPNWLPAQLTPYGIPSRSAQIWITSARLSSLKLEIPPHPAGLGLKQLDSAELPQMPSQL